MIAGLLGDLAHEQSKCLRPSDMQDADPIRVEEDIARFKERLKVLLIDGLIMSSAASARCCPVECIWLVFERIHKHNK